MLLACVAMSIFSCRKQAEKENEIPAPKLYSTKIFGEDYSFISRETGTKKLNNPMKKMGKFKALSSSDIWETLSYDEIEMPTGELADFNAFVNLEFSPVDTTTCPPVEDTTTPFEIVLYMSDYVDLNSTTSSVVHGISKFYLHQSGSNYSIEHRYYKVGATNAYMKPSLTETNLGSYTSIDLMSLLDYSLVGISTATDPYILTVRKDISNLNVVGDNKLGKKIIESQLPIATNPGNIPDNTCDMTICKDRDKPAPCTYVILNFQFYCSPPWGGICKLETIDPFENFDRGTAYDFRDNFLTTSTIGMQYIKYYYQIGYVDNCTEFDHSSYTTEFLALISECYTAAYKLQYGSGSDVIITNDFYDAAMDVIDIYTSHPQYYLYYSNLLEPIMDDLDYFKNKTRDQVFAIIY